MRVSKIAALIAATVVCSAALAQDKVQLLVYTALETDQLKAYQEGFNKVEPNIELKWVRDSTGVITASCWPRRPTPRPMW
jgi:iron(III) transport system substrate-binding protein